MSQPADDLEAVLYAAYCEQAERYARALDLFEALPEAYRQGQTGEEQMGQVAALLAEIAAIEANVAAARQAWQAAGRKPGPDLTGALAGVAELLQRLLASVAEAEQAAKARQARLLPELDALARGRQMQRAYGGAGSPKR